jgi:transformation/transcription domain-associated protein
MDLMRHQTKVLLQPGNTQVQDFLSLIQEMFDDMPAVVHEQLDNPSPTPSNAVVPSTPGSTHNFQSPRPGSPVASVSDLGADPQQQTRPLLKGMQSFKVLAECPIIVVSIFQVYRNTVPPNVKKFVPLIKVVLMLQAKPQQEAHEQAQAKGEIFAGVSPNIRNRAAFGEFITAQVKTMSFLAYLLRVYAQQLTEFLPTLPDIVVRLLKDCPREKSASRKELLVAIRHIINFNFRKIFLKKIDELLDEKTLIGDGLTVYETMRPLAYSMLADLIHHVRDQLDPHQIRKTVEVYTKNLQDSFPGTSFQTMSAKLLLNMAECIARMENKVDARHYLIMILSAIGDKFAAMNRQYPNAVKLSKLYAQQKAENAPDNYLADTEHRPDWDEIDIFTAMPIKTSNPRDRGADPVADNKFLFKTLMNGLKNTFYQLKACNVGSPIDPANAPPHWQEVSYGFTAEEVQVIIKLFREGAYVFRYYEIEKPATESQYSSPVEFMANHYMTSSSKEEKDLLETFATVFHCIDPATFHEVFHQEIPNLYNMIFEHTALLHVPQFFLASEATSPSFAGMLLRFLMDRIDQVGTADIKKSSILLRLFKLAFMAVTLFSNQNEQVLLPHVLDIVTKSIELSTTAEEPMNYFLLLRSLFRSIGGGKFEHLYKQILPLLEMLLEVLNNLLMAARKPADRDLYVELCLTVPARLSNLLPHLSYLMRPLVVALRAGSDLVGQGLRTLELCVDNLTADYLDPIMAPVIDEVMTALFDHLRPNPYSHFHAHTTMRILGKLGGRNRKFMTGAPTLDFQQYSDDRSSFDLKLNGSKKERAFPVEIGIELAIRKLMEVPKGPAAKKSDMYYKKQALHLIKAQTKLRIGYDNLPEDFARLVRLQAQDLLARDCNADFSALEVNDRQRSVMKKDLEQEMLKKLLRALFFSVSIPDLKDESLALLLGVCRHMAILEVGHALSEMKIKRQPFDVKAGEGPLVIDSRVLADAIVDSLSSDHILVREAAERALKEVYDSTAIIFGSTTQVGRLTFFAHLSNVFCHSCYEEEWFTKAGGSLGINLMVTTFDLGDGWIGDRQLEYVKALLYVIKDMPQDLPAKTRIGAQETLEVLLKRVTKNSTKKDITPPAPVPPGAPRPVFTSRIPHLCNLFGNGLSHLNKHVRETSQKALAIMAQSIGVEVWELLEPQKDHLLNPIYNKPLRALPFAIQIGYIDAVTYCMGLRSDFVQFDELLNRLLMESLALADAADESLAGKPAEQRTHEAIINLRVACIKMLTTAMGFEEFQKGPNNPTRTKIVSVFFKCLYSESKETIEAANDALKVVLSQTTKLPKDLLQNGLRPVLANLQDPRRLSTHGLDGLARLLQLLTTYFKVEIGSRLLDHIKVLAEPNILQRISFTLVEQNDQMKIIAAVFNIFHLLPPAAEHFKDRLVDTVLDLEDKLRRTRYSPFRAPLYKYLNRYPNEVWIMLLGKIEDQKYGRFLAQLLEDPESTPLRSVVLNSVDMLIKNCGDMGAENRETRYAAVINAINVMHSVCKYPGTEGWMEKKENLMWFRLVGKNLEQHLRNHTLPPNLRLAAEQAGEQLMFIFTRYLEVHPKDLDYLFGIVDSITCGDFKPSQQFFSYMYKNIICNDSIEYWKAIVLRSLEVYSSKTASQKTKAFLLHNFVNPIVAKDVMRIWPQVGQMKGPRLIDRSVIESIHTRIWRASPGDPSEDLTQPGIDHTRMEALQLSAMLVKYYHAILQDARKDIIKFGWTYIRLEDIINKHAAYVVIGYFIAHYETPAKIVVQVYLSLLRTNQNEGRALVTQTLELLAPVLRKRCNTAPGDRNPVWASGARRILSEEGQNVQQMTSILHFLVKHAELFYESRDKFVPAIVSAFRKIAHPTSASNESRRLVLQLLNLIWEWEKRRVEDKNPSPPRSMSESPTAKKRKLESMSTLDGLSPSPQKALAPPAERAEYQIPIVFRQKMIKYLVEFIAGLPERYPLPSAKQRESALFHNPVPPSSSTEMVTKSITLMKDLLQPQYWADIDVDLFPNVTDIILASDRTTTALASEKSEKEKPDDKFITQMINTLQVVRIIVNTKSDDWIQKNMSHLQRILEKSIKSENPEIQDCLHGMGKDEEGGRPLKPLLKRILDAVPDDVQMEDADVEGEAEASTSEIITFLSTTATEDLSSGNYISGINILWSLAQRKPSEMDQHISAIMRALQTKLAKEHVAHYATLAAQPVAAPATHPGETPTGIMNEYELKIQTDLMLKAIDIMSMRMEVLGDHRRPFLSVLATLVEKSQSNQLCLKILDMVDGWVFKSEGSWPTLKEKTAVLHKMLTFENRQDQTLLIKFLELVIRIYEDPKITRTELTVRMEHAFLIGTRAQDVDMRNRFMAIFDKSQSPTASARLSYIITSQNWDTLADSYWLAQASQLLLGAAEMNKPIQLHPDDFKTIPASLLFGNYSKDPRQPTIMEDDKYDELMASHRRFIRELGDVTVRDIMEPLTQLQHLDSNTAHEIWVALFPIYWSAMAKDERGDLERGMVSLLTKDYHSRQIDKRPNVIQSLLEGAARAWPECKIPPHVMKFEAKTYDAWYTALVQLENAAIKPTMDSAAVKESNLDALVELYAGLQEDDLFYGTWRRRCQFVETNAALSYEQNGMWDNAQKMYEAAQIKARTGAIPFSPGEYMLWEDHWVLCAQKLQQWDILQEFAKHENFQDLLLECAWRNPEMWQTQEPRDQLDSLIKGVMDAPTPRRTFFQAFMSLLKFHNKTETSADFSKVCDEAIQLSIRKWHQLPKRITNAHIPLLQNFQQLVELHDASVICQSLAQTNQGNLDVKSGELKLLLGTWRDRLPNVWDDIMAWQDLVTWRQHIFGLINTTYLALLPQQGQNANGASFAYRGYHETAWIINRFAHVARKHQLPEVCVSQLTRIYTLPNIEIQEAFLKLREQAKCHFQDPNELNQGLDVINNTNLNYFGPNQKAEFYTLKGMFLDKLNQKNEAEEAFGMALFFDIKLPKAWAEWGYYNDRQFKEHPTNYEFAKNALSCYLEAAGLFKNAKSRKLLTRILWLLSLDDASGSLTETFDAYKGETPVWYWITFIPQLLTGLGHKEAAKAHGILAKIAKSYPQALYFQLRTNREDMLAIKKSQESKDERERRARAAKQAAQQNAAAKQSGSPSQARPETPSVRPDSSAGSRPGTANGVVTGALGPDGAGVKTESTEINAPNAPNAPNATVNLSNTQGQPPVTPAPTTSPPTKKPPWEHTEEILLVLKTAFPLLALSMETMVDQIQKHFKCPPDEDAYRLIVALLNDGLSYVSRMPTSYAQDVKLPSATETNITRFAETILPAHIRKSFEADFVDKKPTMHEYIQKLRRWRDKFEAKLDRRPLHQNLETYSSHLSEFRFVKFDEVEVPGQYLQHKDKNQDFIRIERFLPDVDLVRTIGVCHRRLKIRGHDGSVHPFAIQHPAARHCRREERILQLFRHFNGTLSKRKESRRRNLNFHLPLMIPLAPHIRMVQDDPSYISLQGIFEDHCRQSGLVKDDPVLFTMDKMRILAETKTAVSDDRSYFKNSNSDIHSQKHPDHGLNARMEIFSAIQDKWVPHTIALDYVKASYPQYSDFWLFRRHFSYQYAALTFMTYVLFMNNRYPHKLNISRSTGNVWGSELLASMASAKPTFHNPEPVPFRLTPNLQTLMGPMATEGIFTIAIMAIARSLTEPEFDLEQQLSLFVRDEMIFWFTSSHRAGSMAEGQLRDTVQMNSEIIVKRALSLAQAPLGMLPANQTVIDLVAKAVNPMYLAQADALWMPYL